jgi:hypothetical protein
MTERLRIYYYSVIGGGGGLTGWLGSTLFLRAVGGTQQSLVSNSIYGAVLGATIGVCIAAYEGLVNRSVVRFVKYGWLGLSLGALAGGAGLALAQLFYGSLLRGVGAVAWQTILVGSLCWLLVGGLIGLGEGASKGTQSWKGFLGGLLGGLFGGAVHELYRAMSGADKESVQYQFFLATSLLLLGAAIGAAIALVVAVLKEAWLDVLSGKLTGHRYYVNKYVSPRGGGRLTGVIGSNQWEAQIYLPGDNEVLPRHAEISYANGAPTLTVMPEAAKRPTTFINRRRLTSSTPLSDGDQLQFGSTQVVYRQKRR